MKKYNEGCAAVFCTPQLNYIVYLRCVGRRQKSFVVWFVWNGIVELFGDKLGTQKRDWGSVS